MDIQGVQMRETRIAIGTGKYSMGVTFNNLNIPLRFMKNPRSV